MWCRALERADCGELSRWATDAFRGLDLGGSVASPLYVGWVAGRAEGQPDGFALVRRVGPDWELMAIGCREAARRRGVAKRLLQQLLGAARAGGAERITLEVAEDNLPARRLYESFGFRLFHRRSRYYPPSAHRATACDALELELPLSGGAQASEGSPSSAT